MFKSTRRTTVPALPVLAAAVAYGVCESIALLRSRAIDGLSRLRQRITGP